MVKFLFWTLALVSAHSYIDCVDWRFNTDHDSASTELRDKPFFSDTQGKCEGWARRFPVGRREFGKDDNTYKFRHWVQPTGSQIACPNRGLEDAGSNEAPSNPISLMYAPNVDPPFPRGENVRYGQMTTGVVPGQRLCLRWPGKNHAGLGLGTNPTHVPDSNMVNIALAPEAGKDPTQSVFNNNIIGTVPYRRCTAGRASDGDQTGRGSELAFCGGCVTIPDRAPGIYTLQWRWELKPTEIYASCADIQIVAKPGNTPTPKPTPAVAPSPTPEAAGTTVVYDDALQNGWVSWSWATTKKLDDPNGEQGKSISQVLEKWGAIFLWNPKPTSLTNLQLDFSVRGQEGQNNQKVEFALIKDTVGEVSEKLGTFDLGYIPPTSWKKISIKLSDLVTGKGETFKGMWWQARSEDRRGNFYVDNIVLRTVTNNDIPMPVPVNPVPNTPVTFVVTVDGLTQVDVNSLVANKYQKFLEYTKKLVPNAGDLLSVSHHVTVASTTKDYFMVTLVCVLSTPKTASMEVDADGRTLETETGIPPIEAYTELSASLEDIFKDFAGFGENAKVESIQRGTGGIPTETSSATRITASIFIVGVLALLGLAQF